MLERLRRGLAKMIWPAPRKGRVMRMYASARPSRLSGGFVSNSSADMELATGLTTLRNRSRELDRDAPYAKRAKQIVVNNVIGAGIGMQSIVESTRGKLNEAVNEAIEEEWGQWSKAENCHTGGSLHFNDFERAMMGQIFEAGEVFVRKYYQKFALSRVPFALELIEPERIADETAGSPRSGVEGAMVRMGIEVDDFYRPLGYFIRARHQGEFRLGPTYQDSYEWVPADQIWHLRLIDRWPQTRGVPWMHAAIRKLGDMDGYTEAEITAARAAACYMGWVKSEYDPDSPVGGEEQEDGSMEMEFQTGMIKRLGAGEDMGFFSPNRPNAILDPFMRYMIREMAAGTGVSYESLSRDYSQSNFSSSRLALIDDRDLWRYFQKWFIRSFRLPLHCQWLQAAVLSRAVTFSGGVEAYSNDLRRYEKVRFKPRGWTWIDPTNEVDAYVKAVRAGFMDVEEVITLTGNGRDRDEVWTSRARELEDAKTLKLEFDTDPERLANGGKAEKPAPAGFGKPGAGGPPKPGGEDKPADDAADKPPAGKSLTIVTGGAK